MSRIPIDGYFGAIATVVAMRATCIRGQVGCVLINKHRHIIGTGYNGPHAGAPHCIDTRCAGSFAPSGQGLDLCEAIHAEQNALLQCHNVHDIMTCYVTTAPCVTCTKLLLNTSCQRIAFIGDYPHAFASEQLWTKAGREWKKISDRFDLRIDYLLGENHG